MSGTSDATAEPRRPTRITILTWDDDGEHEIGSVAFRHGRVVIDDAIAPILADTPVVQPENPQRQLTLADGPEYIRGIALRYARSTYVHVRIDEWDRPPTPEEEAEIKRLTRLRPLTRAQAELRVAGIE